MIEKAKVYSSKILFLGLTPVDETKVDPIPWAPEKSYINENIKRYNSIIKRLCQKNNVHFMEVLSKFKKQEYSKLLEDGVHPNTRGHKLIFKIVKEYLEKHRILK